MRGYSVIRRVQEFDKPSYVVAGMNICAQEAPTSWDPCLANEAASEEGFSLGRTEADDHFAQFLGKDAISGDFHNCMGPRSWVNVRVAKDAETSYRMEDT